MKKSTLMRVDKYLSESGLASRRNARRFLKENEFTVNGIQIKTPETKIDVENETVMLNGKELTDATFVYYLLYKPKNVISTTSDELGREDVTSLIPTNRTIYPVGRLDKDTTGLIILTDDGELTHQLTHPRYHVPKTYHLTIKGKVTAAQLKTLRDGVELNDGKTLPAEAKIVSESDEDTILELIIHEGRNRQVRRMCGVVGLKLTDLERVAFGSMTKEGLKEGEYRELTKEEVTELQNFVTKQ